MINELCLCVKLVYTNIFVDKPINMCVNSELMSCVNLVLH
jgi:hypothetical protein